MKSVPVGDFIPYLSRDVSTVPFFLYKREREVLVTFLKAYSQCEQCLVLALWEKDIKLPVHRA